MWIVRYLCYAKSLILKLNISPMQPCIIDAASGSSMDWALHVGVKYALAAELRDRGEHGFLLPVEQVKPVGRETWLGIREMAKLVKQWELD